MEPILDNLLRGAGYAALLVAAFFVMEWLYNKTGSRPFQKKTEIPAHVLHEDTILQNQANTRHAATGVVEQVKGLLEAMEGRIGEELATNRKAHEAFVKAHRSWMTTMFGDNGSGYAAIDEDAESLREQAAIYQRRYKLSWEEAMDRAKANQTYKTNDGGMGDQA